MAYTLRDMNKFLRAGELIEVDGKSYRYVSASYTAITFFAPGTREVQSANYGDIKKISPLDLRKSEYDKRSIMLVHAGASVIADPDRSSVTPDSGAVFIETYDDGFFLGCVSQIRCEWNTTFKRNDYYLDLCDNQESRIAYDSLRGVLPLPNIPRGVKDDVNGLKMSEILNMYALKDVDFTKLPPLPDAVELVQSAAVIRQLTADPFDVPFRMTTQPDGYLPDMTDFTLEREGSVDDGWYSTVPIKGDRALTAGETLTAFLVNHRDGEISRIDWKPPEETLAREKWPAAFAKHIASQKVGTTAGAWREDNTFSTEAEPGANTRSKPLRLWCHAKYRAFTTAPFFANQVQVLACNDNFPLTHGQTLCLQVRDLKTQALFEQHFFQMTDKAGAGWSKPLCEQINRDSRLLRAGVLNEDCQVAPTDKGNAFWGPQCAELSVTLTLTNWWKSREVEMSQPLDADTTVSAWVFDAFSNRLLAKHEWTPSNAQQRDEKWPTRWANALNASEVSPYLRASVSPPVDANVQVMETDSLGLWHRGDGLRIFTSLPDIGNWLVERVLELPQGSNTTDDLRVTVRHPFTGQVLHEAIFTPEEKGVSQSDQKAWSGALIEFLKEQAWPELQLRQNDQKESEAHVWIPRFCELQIELDPVDDETLRVVGADATASPKLEIVPGVSSFQVSVVGGSGELEFRLNRAAFDRGVRVAACRPVVLGVNAGWPISVTADRITWGSRTVACTYEVTLDYPEKLHGGTQETVGTLGVFSETQFWQVLLQVKSTPPSALAPYEPTSLLCEDYGNTERSEIFDTLGLGESGVDPRTGLFHAHYPVATLQGRNGLGPICDLTLHYSALRGNEAGLGDGWAWRFSSLDVRDRCLTLANGVRITFTLDEWKTLGEGKLLKKKHCAVKSNKDYSEFTLDLPSGRRDVLSKPRVAGGDETEPNAEFVRIIISMLEAIKEKSKPKFPSVPSHWTQWVLIVLSPVAYSIGARLDYDEAVAAWEKHGSVKELDERIAYYQRPFIQLVPSRIVSLYGEVLDLEWKRQKGQLLLVGIKSGDKALFSADYPNPAPLRGEARVRMQVWPETDESFYIELKLQDCLLRTLTRRLGAHRTIVQQVECHYADDPTLDRILCRLTELDGSVECVQYRPGILGKGKPLWPQAVLHALIPGNGQENQLTTYRYTGRLLDTSDQLYIVEGERGAHGAREHHLQVFGLDSQNQRQELIAGSASADSQWLEFKVRQPAKDETREETGDKDKDGKPIIKVTPRQPPRSEILRYTGYGDDLIKALEQIKLEARENKVVVAWADERVDYQQEIVEILWRYGRRGRLRLIRSIQALMQVLPAAQRPALGKGIDRLITEENDDGLPVELITLNEGTRHLAYYPAEGGDNFVSAKALNELVGVSGMPQLSCPKLPDHVVSPLMAEYHYDDFGHSLGLKLFGYRQVERDGRTFLELERQVVIEGIGVKGHFDGPLSSSTEWEKTADEVLWRERITSVSPADPKATPSGESKVREWSISDKQVAHLGKKAFALETNRTCEDNPTRPFIVVRTVSTTQAGSEPISTEHYSRYSQRCLSRIEDGIETTWGYDVVGRVVDEAQYRLNPGKKSRGDGQKADRRTQTEYSKNGKLATRRHDNGDETLAYLDGLQRTWRSEWRRAGSKVYLPLHECALQGLDESQVMGRFEWDYLPGGQAVIERDQVQLQEGRQPWMTARGVEVEKASTAGTSGSRVTEYQPNYEVSFLGFDGAKSHDADEFFRCLMKLNELPENEKDPSQYFVGSDPIVILINRALTLGYRIFDYASFDGVKFLKFANGLAGLKGNSRRLMDSRSDVLINVLENGRIQLKQVDFDFERLKGVPDKIDFEPWDFEAYLDLDSAQKAQASLILSPTAKTTHAEVVCDFKTGLNEEHGLANQRLSQHTTEYLTKTDGTFERTQTLSDGTGQQHLKLTQHLDSNGLVVRSARAVDDETRIYVFDRDALGRVTKITRPDNTLIERTYHGFSNQITELKVGGKVVATQTMVNHSSLKSRKVGSRIYTFKDDSVTLPDNTKMQTQVDADGVKWGADDSPVASLTRKNGVTTVASGSSVIDTWKHSFIQPSLPGRRKQAQITPRSESKTVEWQSLRGNTVASLRADGHLQRAFADHEGRVLRTCQEHEDVAYRYDPLGQLQSRQVHALKAGEQWQVLSEHDGFGQEVKRTFLLNGAPRFEHRMTWRGDGRLASKVSYEAAVLRSTERFSYDLLDRLERYTCEAEKAEYCPQDVKGNAVKAQVFTWDVLDNLVSCVTTDFDGLQVTKAFSYDANDPTRMTAAKLGAQSETLSWSGNGYLEAAEAQGPKFAYNACGQLSKVSDASNELLARYEYDGYQRLAAQYVKKDDITRELRYEGDELIGEIWFDEDRTVTRRTSVSAGLAEYDGEEVRWLIDDPQVGIAGQVKGGEISLAPLLPFGEGAALDEVVVGYNGMRRDPVTGQYHAGNGYRSYDPTLCRYSQPDWLAPVGEGGINPYQHCPDPVNLHDPSGAIMISRWEQNQVMQNLEQELQDTQAMEVGGKWRGLALSLVLTVIGVVATVFSGGTAAVWLFAALTALSVASFGLEVASVLTAESNPELSRRLGIASMATGILSAACFMGTVKAGLTLLKQTIRAVGRTARYIGRAAQAFGRGVVRLIKGQRSAASIAKGALGALPRPTWGMRVRTATRKAMRTVFREVDDYFGAPAPLQPMPTYERSGWLGKLMSAWDGPDPTKLTGRPARLYAWANQSRFVSKVNELGGLAIEANILRGTGESSYALAQGDDSSSISVQARAKRRSDNPYKPREVASRYDLWTALGLSG